jgi:ABC-type oligopeptide transport system ATPase subunit
MNEIILGGRDLVRTFGGGRRWYGAKKPTTRAVDGVSLSIERGTTVGVVGESGCGKSTLARMLTGLLAPTAGEIRLEGRPVHGLKGAERLAFHRTVQLVFQDPLSSLNPRRTVRQILQGPLQALLGLGRKERAARVEELMQLVSLRPEFIDRYPHEFSGGQCQRIGIARALAALPRLLVLDEPVSALDVSVQAQVLKLLRDLQHRLGLTYVFISHDLAVVEALCDRVMVMHRGQVVEEAERAELFARPQHPYTRQLLSAVPVPGRQRQVG